MISSRATQFQSSPKGLEFLFASICQPVKPKRFNLNLHHLNLSAKASRLNLQSLSSNRQSCPIYQLRCSLSQDTEEKFRLKCQSCFSFFSCLPLFSFYPDGLRYIHVHDLKIQHKSTLILSDIALSIALRSSLHHLVSNDKQLKIDIFS